MKKLQIFFLIIILILVLSAPIYAFNIYRVGNAIIGREYNDVWKRWFDKQFSIWVGIDDKKEEYIFFKANTGLGDATVVVTNTNELMDKLEKAILKAIEWSDVARKNKADTTKGLGCFGPDAHGLCEKNSSAYKKGQMSLTFFAANGGKQTDLIVNIIDKDNQFVKSSIYIGLPQMKKLLQATKGIDTAFQKAREATKKQDMFK
jgi:hypothetical protein